MEYNQLNSDSLKNNQDLIVLKDENKNKYAMRWFKVTEDDMAPMPKMAIKKDVQYKMNIKKYESYQKFDRSLEQKSPAENKELLKPMKKKKK